LGPVTIGRSHPIKIPFGPLEPFAFADTEGLRSFYAVYHDRDGRVVRFDKLRFVRVEKGPREVKLPAAEEPGAALYFKLVPGAAPAAPGVGTRIEYPETELLDEFFAGKVGPSGVDGKVALSRKEVAFTDTYTYWPNGQLRTRVMSGPDQPSTEEHFDADGRKLPGRAPAQEAGHEE
jgi:hypothetical protein